MRDEHRQFHPDTVYVIYIAATPDKVWQALTSAEFSRQYSIGFAVEMEPKSGGAFKMLAPDRSLHIDGNVIAHDPPHKLIVTWNVNWPVLWRSSAKRLSPTRSNRLATRFGSR